jgi:hypothetical protein
MELIQASGEKPQARFGHSITLIANKKAILFGGAIGDSQTYQPSNDAFLFECVYRKWKKLNPVGDIPPMRAAHAAAKIREN